MPHHANRGMTSVDQVFNILDDDSDTLDVKDVTSLTPVCPPYPSAGRYSVSTPRLTHRPQDDQQPKRQRAIESDITGGHIGKNCDSSASTSAVASTNTAIKQRDVSEYNYAQALLKQASKLTSSRDLDRTSVLRLAQAYITLQHGLQSWESCCNQTRWWPPNIDGGKLALAAQETLNCFVLIITSKGQVVYISDAVESLLGHDQLNLVGHSIENLLPPEEMSVLADQFTALPGPSRGGCAERSFYTRMLSARRSGLHQKLQLVHAVGHIQEVALASGVASTAGQRETWLMCACRVMSPQLESEGSDSSCTEWVSHNALDGIIIYMDARSCQVTGYLPNEMLGLSPYCFVHQDDQEYVAFSHNQALINVGGSSCTYRMYTHSQDVVYVHSTIQLARDKYTNKPKFLFCLHRLVDEQEGREQVARHQQELMWSKSDPSIKYSMTDIERTVKALEVEGGNSPLVMSRGGMKTSVLTDSCAADGGDLLSINLGNHMRIPAPLVPKLEPGLATSGSSCQQQATPSFYSTSDSQYPQARCQGQLSAQLPGAGNDYGGNYGYDSSIGRPQQQQQTYGRQLSQQQQMYTNIHPQYQQQMSLSSSSQTIMSSSSDSPVGAGSSGSFVDYLFNSAGHSSGQSDGQLMYNTDTVMNQSIISPTGRGRGRSRTRGRPRGSGRGGRGTTRGVRGPRGSRGRGSRGRGRAGIIAQISQSHEVLGGVRKSESLISQGSLSPISIHGSMSPRSSLSPMAGSGEHLFMSPDSGIGLQRSSSAGTSLSHQQMTGGSRMDVQQMTSGGSRMDIQQMAGGSRMDIQHMSSKQESSNQLQSENMADLHRMHSDDMFQRMSSLDSMDILEPSTEFSLHHTPSIGMMSPRSSWGVQDRSVSAQLSPYRTMSGIDHMPGKRVGRPRGSRNQLERQQHFQRTMSIDDPSMSSHLGFGPSQQSLYGQDSPYHSQSPSSATFLGESSRGTGNNSSLSYQGQGQQANNINNSVQGQGSFQRSLSFQSQAGGRMAADTDPEHSILGNLLKGRGGSTSSAGSKSPAQSVLNNLSRSGLALGLDRSGRSPLAQPILCDRGVRSPAHSLISEAASPVSAFSPDSSMATPSVIKDEPEVIPSMDETSCCPPMFASGSPSHSKQQQQQQHDDVLNFVLDQGEHKNIPEMQMFSNQLKQKHRSLEQSLISQDTVLRQLETTMQQTANDSNSEALCAKLNLIKANKTKQEKELRVIQAKLEAQVHQHLQQRPGQQQPHLSLQQHRLTTPVPASTRRMAIVPPLQRQPTEEDLNPILSHSSPGDLKAGQTGGGIQQSSPDVGAKQQPVPGNSSQESGAKANPVLLASGQQQSSRQTTQEPSVRIDGSFPSTAQPQSAGQLQQLHPPQQSPFSLHHHHHHHHHYHHHSLPQQINFPNSLKDTPPPPAYGSYDNSVFSSSAAAASGSVTPGPLSISVSSTTTSLASPIICDTSPVSVDESPSCASDASSGYHSLSHGADALTNLCVGPFNKPHCIDMASASSGSTFGSKTPSGYDQTLKGAGRSPDKTSSSSAHISSNSPLV